ncbi:Cytochrome P450 71D11 [Glycine soja]|uniref:Cytochrome P450 71D11 n=2 Tax=Glycine subgen. Soja TaxID=1462606 RepID=A0A0R0EFN4_SOYBN|nr:Cytochrome P450 71D11 [Glycine soja]
MDSEVLNILALVVPFFLFMILALKIARNHTITESSPKVPPGPWKLPIIGNIHHLITSTPHRKLRLSQNIWTLDAFATWGAEYAKEIMKTHDLIFASRPHTLVADILAYESTSIITAPYGRYWRQLLKICTVELFTQKRLSINLAEIVVLSIYNIISRAAFGMKSQNQEEFISAVKELVTVAAGFNIGDLFPSVKWLQRVTEGKDETEEDLVDVLLKFLDVNDSNQDICLTINNMKAIILDIFAAGGETATTTINWVMAEIIRDPRVMKKAQVEVREVFNTKGRVDEICINELKYLKSVVKETLRLHPPAPLLLPRECGQTCEIDGYHIPVKSKVIVNAWAIGRDPKYWSEAERFYPERFIDSSIDYKGTNFEYIPFVAGRRICPGSTFGLINVELALAFLLYHFDWKLPNEMKSEDLDMTEEFGLTVTRKEDIYLIPVTSRPFSY